MDIGFRHQQIIGIPSHDAVGATAVEVTRGDDVTATTLDTDHASVAISALGMTDGQVFHPTTLTAHETQTEGITGIDLNT